MTLDTSGYTVVDDDDDDPVLLIQPGDQVVEQAGATVYLDESAATMLDDKVLDAAVDEGGRVEFALGVQG